ncbi:MAG: GNAT family N-acetyltransferase [Ruminococcaceae bacterium]|nr:GNAT family N-acetyltransferase [Oscillospiraceae bacterium]
MKYYPKVTGERIYLSPICPDDAGTYTRWLNDPEITNRLGNSTQVFSLLKERKLLEELAQEGPNFAIIRGADDTLLGNISFFGHDAIQRRAECGLFIGAAESRGQGYGTEALRLLLHYGFGILNLHNVMLRVFSFNHQAITCYEKVGFKRMGARRQAYTLHGVTHDEVYMDILASEFQPGEGGYC